MPKIATTDLDVSPLCLGGNVFGWTADEPTSFGVLDAYAAAGGNFIDTADVYSAWAPGNTGGESEKIIGRWMRERRNRDKLVVATKVGSAPGLKGLAPETIRAAVALSLQNLQTDRIDLYYAHIDDEKTPLAETLRAFDGLVHAGKVRHIAASNYTAPRLAEALAISKREGLVRYVALQNHYNLVHRSEVEGELQELCVREGVSIIPYYALARGFLTGKYRPGVKVESVRAKGAEAYLDERGVRLLGVLDEVAAAHRTTVSAVALRWLVAQKAVVSAIASARTPEQLADLVPITKLELSREELERLGAVSST